MLPREVDRLAAVRRSGVLPAEAASVAGRWKGRGVVERDPLERAYVIALAIELALCGEGRRREREREMGGGKDRNGTEGRKGWG